MVSAGDSGTKPAVPNQLDFEGKRVINSLTADELKFTNTTAVGDLGPVVTSHRRAK